MKKILKIIALSLLGMCTLNFFALGGMLLYVLSHFNVTREKASQVRLALDGQRFMTKEEEEFLGRFKKEDISAWRRKATQQLNAITQASELLKRQEAALKESQVFLEMLAEQTGKKKKDAEDVLAKAEAERAAAEKARQETAIEMNSPSFKKRYEALLRMEPAAAAEVLGVMTADEAAKYLALMPSRRSAAILDALRQRPDGAKFCVEILSKIRLPESSGGAQ